MKKLILALILSTPIICSAADGWNCYGLKFNASGNEKKKVCISMDNKRTTGIISCDANVDYLNDYKSNKNKFIKVNQSTYLEGNYTTLLFTTKDTNNMQESSATSIFVTEEIYNQLRLDHKFNLAMEQEFDECDYTENTFEYTTVIHNKSIRKIGTYKPLDAETSYCD